MNTFAKSVIFAAALAVGGVAMAQEPPVNIGQRHGNLREAQQLVREAFDDISNAQVDNDYALGGHAGRAKELLREASVELKLAAETSNYNQR
ncbi:MAG TPA: hypothetical protein VK801_04110 [Caulobacteraceae bacterium]|nr:hypothetical protein [Caulobacteraceae bacterium]